jgi:hypothetical protein
LVCIVTRRLGNEEVILWSDYHTESWENGKFLDIQYDSVEYRYTSEEGRASWQAMWNQTISGINKQWNFISNKMKNHLRYNVKRLFETCTDDLQNPKVCAIMQTFKRQGLRAFRVYGDLERDLFTQLEPIMRGARGSIELLENDADVVKAKKCITDIYTCIFNEVSRERELPVQPPVMAVSDSHRPDDPMELGSLLAKLQTYAV